MAMFDLDRLITDLFKTTVLPGIAIGLWLTDLIGRCTCAVAVLLFLVGFVILPIIFKYSYALQKSILFLTFITYPPNLDLKRPEKSGLYATRNFYVNHHDHEEDLEVNVAVWHVLPLDLVRRYAKELHVDEVRGKRGSSRLWRASTLMMRSVRICLKRTLQSSPFAAGRSIAVTIELPLLRSEVIFTILSTKCCAHSIRFGRATAFGWATGETLVPEPAAGRVTIILIHYAICYKGKIGE
uniref:Uncharacterized protein n=1 Tax=Anopheles melas TaxID=34690 RepID=A0A182U6Y2_9DIPT